MRLDHKTDEIIQSSIRHELGKDVTLITIAHRLQTIMDADKIVCLIPNSTITWLTKLIEDGSRCRKAGRVWYTS